MEEMRIIELSVKGIRKLEACEIQFVEGVNVLMGKTRQGKTSVLDTLSLGLKGLRSKEPRDLIHHGKDEGNIVTTFEIGSKLYKVERILKQGKPPQLKLWLLEGDKPKTIASPQKFLDELIPAIGETPGTFLKKSALEKLRFILQHHNVDMSNFEDVIKGYEEKRTELTAQQKLYAYAEKEPDPEANAELKKLEAELTELQTENEAIEKKWVDKAAEIKAAFAKDEAEWKAYSDVLETLKPAETSISKQELKVEFEKNEIARLEKELEERKAGLRDLEKGLTAAKASLAKTKAGIKEIKEPDKAATIKKLEQLKTSKNAELKDTTVLEAQIKTVKENSTDVDTYKKDHENFIKKAAEIKAVNANIKAVKQLLLKTLSEIPSKLEGLVIEPGDEEGTRPKGLYVNGIFSEEWSGAEGFAIAAKLLRRYSGQSVMIIDGGESIYYDTEAFREFCEWARNDGVQVIISVVGEKDPGEDADKGFIIEDGGVREIQIKQGDLL